MTQTIIGFDAGNSDTTLAWRDGDHQRHLTVPSFLGSGTLRNLKTIRAGAGGSGRLAKDELVLDHAGRSTFVGQLALTEARDATAARNDVTRYWSGHTLKLLLATAGAAGLDGQTVRIMTGLPVSVWTPEARRAVQKGLQGVHQFVLNGKPMSLTVDAVGVMMEGAAVLAGFPLDKDTPQAVIDIGGRTTDLMWFLGTTPVGRLCAGLEAGVEKAMDMVGQTILEGVGRHLAPMELHKVFRAYAAGKSSPTLYHRGQTLDQDGYVAAAVDAVAGDVLSFVSRTWGDDRGQVATDAARVVLIGGGAHYFRDRLRAILPQLVVPATPELANALGYLQVGLKASDAGWNRQKV
jgi:hypothetical protein